MTTIDVKCTRCNGKGWVGNLEDCERCNGEGTLSELADLHQAGLDGEDYDYD